MATIAYLTGGAISTLTPQKVVSSYLAPATDSYDALNVARLIPFTPSEAGTCAGAFIGLWLNSKTGTDSVTVKLQQFAGGAWGDVAGATKQLFNTNADMIGSYGPGVDINGNAYTNVGNMMWTYFAFDTPAAVTTDASTWRLSVISNTINNRILKNGADYAHAVVLSEAAVYAPGDTALFKNFETFAVDESLTFDTIVTGTQTTITWENPPVASYTLTVTNFRWSKNLCFHVGTEVLPIPYAQQAIINVTNYITNNYWTAANGPEWVFYGEKPVEAKWLGYLSVDALGGQAKIVTTVDKSALWTVGDTLDVTGGGASNAGYETMTIASFLGAEVTLTANLVARRYNGYAVINVSEMTKAGIQLRLGNPGMHAKLTLSGVVMNSDVRELSNAAAPDYARCSPYILDTVTFLNQARAFDNGTSGAVNTTNTYPTRKGSVFRNIYVRASVGYCYFTIWMAAGQSTTIENVFVAQRNQYMWLTWTLPDSTITNVQASGSSGTPYGIYVWSLTHCTATNIRTIGASSDGIRLSAVASTITALRADGDTYGIRPSGNIIDTEFVDCEFGQNIAVINTLAQSSYLIRAVFRDCIGAFVYQGDDASALVPSSYVKVVNDAQVANDHRSWWKYGKMQSVGAGLADTTVHTAGASKFAIRFQPASSTNRLEWAFATPTGNILGRTMTVAVWCKINAAAYYAGTHQKPRLTVRYDNATDAYAEAVAGTGWQLLSVTFTPTTAYGQITVTLSGMTDAVGSDAYIYFDDFAVLYPAGYVLDLGGMDLWADALPITPPIATVISASDVWNLPASQLVGAGTVGQALTAMLNGRYHYDKTTGVETILDAEGKPVSARTVTDTANTVQKA